MIPFKKKENGRPDLQTIPSIRPSLPMSGRNSTEFAKGGNGGAESERGVCQHDISLNAPCKQCEDELVDAPEETFTKTGASAFVDIEKLEKVMKPRLPRLANLLGELTYAEMLHFSVETMTGNLVETIDPMTASPEAHLLAKRLHIWLTKRRA